MTRRTINGVELEIGPGINLRYANLRGANLRGANLCDADLRNARITFQGRAVVVRFEEITD